MRSETIETDSIVQHDIDEVEVVGMRKREVVPAQELSGAQLKQLSAHSVADAVRYFAGIQIKDFGGVGGLKTVDIRSMGTNHLGVFYDGLQIGNAQNGTVDLGKFSLDNMEEVTVYNGQKSDVFQSAKDFGASGTLYLRTRRPQFSDNKNYNLNFTFRAGSFGLINPSVLIEHKIKKYISYSANAEYTRASGKYKFRINKRIQNTDGQNVVVWDTAGIRQNGDIEAIRLEGTLFGSFAGGQWHTKIYFYDSERGLPRAIIRNVWTSAQRQWDRDFFIQGNIQKTLYDNKLDSKLSAKYSYNFMHYVNPDTTMLYINNSFWQKAVYVSSANCFRTSSMFDLGLSADYERNWLTSDMKNFVFPHRNSVLVALSALLHTSYIKIQGNILASLINDHATHGKQHSGDFRQWTKKYTPALFVNYKPLKNRDLSIIAFYKRMFRMPTFNDLYYTDIGNISLNPEFATQYNIGCAYNAQHQHFKYETSINCYFNEVDNKIIAVPKGNSQYRWMMMNVARVEIRGLDATAKLYFVVNKDFAINAHITYTYQKAQDMTNPNDNGPKGTYKGQISYVPWHSGSGIAYMQWKTWHLNYSFIYVGERYHTSANIPANYEPTWYTHDLNICKIFKNKYLPETSLTIEVNNIFNQQYNVVLNYPMPGRNFKAIFKINI